MLQSLPLILHDRRDDRKFLQARSLQFCIQMIAESLLIGFYLLRSDHSLSYQRFCIDHCRIVMPPYNLIQGRLCESRFVPFIMSIFSITNYIDKDIMPKSHTILHCQKHSTYYRFGIIGIDMQHRRLESFSYICTIGSRARI